MKNRTFIDSVLCALKGLLYCLKTEKNYKYYFCIAFTFLCLNFLFGVGLMGNICLIVTVSGVFSAECLNTAIEHTIDMIDTEIKPEIRIIKDVAAAGVVCWGFAFFITEFIMIGSCII